MYRFSFVFFLLLSISTSAEISLNFNSTVVKVLSTIHPWSVSEPWTKGAVNQIQGSGVMIEPGMVLTNAHCVESATFIQLEFMGLTNLIEARIAAVNHQVDLALLKFDMPENFKPVQIKFGTLPELREKVITVGFPIGGSEISYTEGVVSRIDVEKYFHSNIPNLIVQTDAALNPGNSGGPVISGKSGEILGIATQKNFMGDSIGYFIPNKVIDAFLKDYQKNGKITGIPSLGIIFQSLENPTLRDYLKMGSSSGIRITEIAGGSSADGTLHTGEVILAIDGCKLSNTGKLENFEGLEKINYIAGIYSRNVGDKMKFSVLREGKTCEVEVVLKPYVDNVIPSCPRFDMQLPYHIEAGLVFMEVESLYIQNWRKNYDSKAWRTYNVYMETPVGSGNVNRLVVISNILSAKVNVGYVDCVDVPIRKINSIEVESIADVKKSFAGNTGDFHVIELSDSRIVIIPARLSTEDKKAIKDSYGLPE